MRTIRFRGKRLIDGEWEFGWLFHDQVYDGFSFANDVMVIRDENDSDYCVKKETVGQFTGKSDDGEDELYDGDIIRFDCGRTTKGVIGWSEEHCAWIVKEIGNKNEFMLSDCFDDFIEKIGNIHDNPELLK